MTSSFSSHNPNKLDSMFVCTEGTTSLHMGRGGGGGGGSGVGMWKFLYAMHVHLTYWAELTVIFSVVFLSITFAKKKKKSCHLRTKRYFQLSLSSLHKNDKRYHPHTKHFLPIEQTTSVILTHKIPYSNWANYICHPNTQDILFQLSKHICHHNMHTKKFPVVS